VASAVKELAEEHGIPVFTPAHPSDPGFVETLTELAPDSCAVVAYGALLPPAVLGIPPHGWINQHFSPLPAWRGQHRCSARSWPEMRSLELTFRSRKDSTPGRSIGVTSRPLDRHSG
jgi:hypothetical protein